ncbi:hypothetical protein OESDEN_06720 [Oesophagostomum dentatum]|uniref:C-type lectin domain-containing protein n=1 Tax=Oesophagostomum dentatum TaxID=61180 RepID=A0A0B1TDD0_OESDE|nr:hypothetical protein OESDEN_06720 [Oesophagostomum dentatum]
MFAADSMDEWNEVMSFTPLYFWAWTGIVQEEATDAPYVKGGQLDASKVNWLVKTSSSLANGWSVASKCAAYYNMDLIASNYVYFYPCSYQYYSICEKDLGRR